MTTFGETIEIIVRCVVLRCTVRARVPATELTYGLQTGSTLVHHLHEVVVAVGIDGNTHPDTVTNLQLCGLLTISGQQFTLHDETTARVGNVMHSLSKLCIDGAPRCTLCTLGDGESLAIRLYSRLHIADGSCSLRQLQRFSVNLYVGIYPIQPQSI